MVEKLLKVRTDIKKRKPTYRRQQSNQFAKFKNDDFWRRPKGYQSKIRLGRRGHQGMPTVGFKSPKAVRYLNKTGLQEVIVNNVADLAKIENKNQIAVIGRTVGGRKTIAILNEALKLKLSIGNVKDIKSRIEFLTKTKTPKVEEKKKEVKKAKTTKNTETKTKTEATPKTTKKKEASKK